MTPNGQIIKPNPQESLPPVGNPLATTKPKQTFNTQMDSYFPLFDPSREQGDIW